jgi:hypothetical protein
LSRLLEMHWSSKFKDSESTSGSKVNPSNCYYLRIKAAASFLR